MADKEREIGKISHYFNHINVAIIDLTDTLNKGDKIRIKGHTSDFTEEIESMQENHQDIETAKKGHSIGVKVSEHARVGDAVYKVNGEA